MLTSSLIILNLILLTQLPISMPMMIFTKAFTEYNESNNIKTIEQTGLIVTEV